MELSRRSFFFGAGACALAQAVPINLKQVPFLWGDGVHDDTDALNAFFRGERIEASSAVLGSQKLLSGGRFLISDSIRLCNSIAGWAGSEILITGSHPVIDVSGPCDVTLTGLCITYKDGHTTYVGAPSPNLLPTQ